MGPNRSSDLETDVIDHIVRDARGKGADPEAAVAATMLELARRGAVAAQAELQRARSDLLERERQCERARERLRTGMKKYTTEWCAKLQERASDAAKRILYAQGRFVRARAQADAWQVNLLQALRDFGPMLEKANRERLGRELRHAERAASDEQRAAVG